MIDSSIIKGPVSTKFHSSSNTHSATDNHESTNNTSLATKTTDDKLKNQSIAEDKIKQSPSKLELFLNSYQGLAQFTSDKPKPVDFGLDYYQKRADDFRRRNPGMEPPDYYLEYGDKYANRFASLDRTDLSAEGLEWRDRTLQALQQAIEDKRIEDPEGFAELERNPQAFREFAYATHPDAYVDSGLYDLPAQDLAVIAATPDLGDVLTQDGIQQTLVTMGKLDIIDVADIAASTVEQTVRDMPGAAARQAERIADRFTDHTDWSRFPPIQISFPKVPNPFD